MYHGKHARHRHLRQALRILAVLLVVACLIYPFWEPYRLHVHRVDMESANLSRDVGQLRIVYLSDIHEDSFPYFTQSRTEALISRVNSLHADLVLLGGDYTNGTDGATDFFNRIRYGKHFQSVYGCFGVLGEHDRDLDDESTTALRAAMVAAGITPLINDSYQLRIGSSTVSIAGVDDVNSGWPDLKSTAAKIHADDFAIVMCHNPQIIPDLSQSTDADGRRNWYDLGLFGHTHGGQLPFLGGLLHLTDDIRPEYHSGIRIENRAPMIVSNGIGTVSIPARLFRMPEILLITVRATR